MKHPSKAGTRIDPGTSSKPDAGQPSSAEAAKAAYVRKSDAKLGEARAKLEIIRSKTTAAGANRPLQAADTIDKALSQCDASLQRLRQHLEELQSVDDDSWVELREGIEKGWENLARSMQQIVKRFNR